MIDMCLDHLQTEPVLLQLGILLTAAFALAVQAHCDVLGLEPLMILGHL